MLVPLPDPLAQRVKAFCANNGLGQYAFVQQAVADALKPKGARLHGSILEAIGLALEDRGHDTLAVERALAQVDEDALWTVGVGEAIDWVEDTYLGGPVPAEDADE